LKRLFLSIEEAYGALGLDGTRASANATRARFRALVRAQHPDGKPAADQERATEATRRIIEAFGLLRAAGFPPVPRGAGRPTRGAANDVAGDDPLSWLDEVWREDVRRERPETALTKAVLRAAWWAVGGFVFCAFGGLGIVFGFASGGWTIALLWLALGARLAVGAWRMSHEVYQFWRVFRTVAAPQTVRAVKRAVAVRLGAALVASAIAMAAGAELLAHAIVR
jgi:hypothetical protein